MGGAAVAEVIQRSVIAEADRKYVVDLVAERQIALDKVIVQRTGSAGIKADALGAGIEAVIDSSLCGGFVAGL